MSLQVVSSSVPCPSCQREQRQKDIKADEQKKATIEAADQARKATLPANIGQLRDISV